MNFTPMSSAGGTGGSSAHYTTSSSLQSSNKLQQAVPQMMSVMGESGVQYVRTLEGGAALQSTPQVITLPIAFPGAKPGDPQQTMQIQVLSQNMLQQGMQQPKYMQIPIQGFQQGGMGAVLTVAYAPDNMDGIQILNNIPDGTFRTRSGVQVVATLQQDMQLVQQQEKDQQAILIPNPTQSAVIIQQQAEKMNNNNLNNNNIKIKQEHDLDINDDSSELGDSNNCEVAGWPINPNQTIENYLNKTMPIQQVLPQSLQQYLRLNSECILKKELPLEQDDIADPLSEKSPVVINGDDVTLKPKKKKKYKKRPLKPPRPKPGQVQIAQAVDGTPIYCCPECHMAYPEKEQLELHLSVHKIERRFICGICGAGLKRKEHLERHKLGHNPERPYVCSVCHKGFKRKEHLNLHAVIHSGEKTEICQECGKGFYRKDHLRKHARSHQSRRLREEGAASFEVVNIAPTGAPPPAVSGIMPTIELKPLGGDTRHTILPEITIHVPSTSNTQVPVQISVPHHIISTLANGQQQITLSAPSSSTPASASNSQHLNMEELFIEQS